MKPYLFSRSGGTAHCKGKQDINSALTQAWKRKVPQREYFMSSQHLQVTSLLSKEIMQDLRHKIRERLLSIASCCRVSNPARCQELQIIMSHKHLSCWYAGAQQDKNVICINTEVLWRGSAMSSSDRSRIVKHAQTDQSNRWVKFRDAHK